MEILFEITFYKLSGTLGCKIIIHYLSLGHLVFEFPIQKNIYYNKKFSILPLMLSTFYDNHFFFQRFVGNLEEIIAFFNVLQICFRFKILGKAIPTFYLFKRFISLIYRLL